MTTFELLYIVVICIFRCIYFAYIIMIYYIWLITINSRLTDLCSFSTVLVNYIHNYSRFYFLSRIAMKFVLFHFDLLSHFPKFLFIYLFNPFIIHYTTDKSPLTSLTVPLIALPYCSHSRYITKTNLHVGRGHCSKYA